MIKLASIRHIALEIGRCTKAGFTSLAALALPVIVGSAGLAFDLNRGYQQRVINQRAADMGALAAALAYNANGDATILQPTAQDLAVANGLSGATVTANLLSDTPNAGDQAVRVTVTQDVPFLLGRVLGFTGGFDVLAQSLASLTAAAPSFADPCYLALDPGANAFYTDGGVHIQAPLCSVAAIGSIYHDGDDITASDLISGSGDIDVAHGSHVYANTARFAGNFGLPAWYSGTVPPEEDRIHASTTLVDPWAGDPDLSTGLAVFDAFPNTTPAAIPAPTMPTGSDVNFRAWLPSPVPGATKSGSTFYLPQGNYAFRNYETNGGTSVVFADGSNITISGTFNPGGGAHFGDSSVKIAGNFTTGWGNVSMGDADLHVGGNATFNSFTKGDGDTIVGGTMTVNGTTSFGDGDLLVNAMSVGGGVQFSAGIGTKQVNGGITGGGGTTIEFGDGNLQIGKFTGGSYAGRSIHLGGSTNLYMGDGAFIADGEIYTDGGSAIVFGAATNHYINGNMHIQGAAIFGEGRYSVNGWFKNGTGGASWPRTGPSGTVYGTTINGVNVSSYEMVGIGITILTKDGYNLGGGTSTRLEAAGATTTGGQIGDMLFASLTTNDIEWGAGASSTMAGTVYFPNADVNMSGGNNTGSPPDKCLSAIARRFNITGGAFAGTACDRMGDAITGGGGGGSNSITLIG